MSVIWGPLGMARFRRFWPVSALITKKGILNQQKPPYATAKGSTFILRPLYELACAILWFKNK